MNNQERYQLAKEVMRDIEEALKLEGIHPVKINRVKNRLIFGNPRGLR